MISLLVSVALADSIAFVGATLYPVSAPPIADGVLVIEDDRIAAIGRRSECRLGSTRRRHSP